MLHDAVCKHNGSNFRKQANIEAAHSACPLVLLYNVLRLHPLSTSIVYSAWSVEPTTTSRAFASAAEHIVGLSLSSIVAPVQKRMLMKSGCVYTWVTQRVTCAARQYNVQGAPMCNGQ